MTIKKYFDLTKKVLYPINRSLTGEGIQKTLKIIKKEFPELKIRKILSGSKVYDWKVPPEWNISDAYVVDKNGNKIIDFKVNNLHVVSYSIPINKIITKKDLFKNIYYLKKQPNAIPYITSYYERRWGFCISYKEKIKFDKIYSSKDKFKVVIRSKFNSKGFLNYGELVLKGRSKKEIFISTYICHPSLANNELSGPLVSMCLINHFKKNQNLEKTIRFIFIPETIGSIVYLNKNLKNLKANVIGGYNLSCIGDNRQHSCMLSKQCTAPSDIALIEAYKRLKIKYKTYSFLQRGSDERQYNSPGIDLPISSIFRTMYGMYPEYHTSLDNFNLVTLKGITGGFKVAKTAIEILLKNRFPRSKILCEPKMDKRGLYPTLGTKYSSSITRHYMDFLIYSDGRNSLERIAEIIKISKFKSIEIYKILNKNNLLK